MTRIFHTWDKWECYPAGFYELQPKGRLAKDECERIYAELLRDDAEFRAALARVTSEWKNSCEHYLSNERMNRIAWLGQASLCIAKGIPANYRSGFNLLSQREQQRANEIALEALNGWLVAHGESPATLEQAGVNTIVDLY